MSDIKAHQHTFMNGHVPEWWPERAPDLDQGHTTGRLRGCSWCGSMHPADLAQALRAGARGHWADFKYGWPHKWYVDGVPNPHAGMLESRMSSSHAVPVCPKTGEACGDRRQSFSRPECQCMREAPETVKRGMCDGRAVVSAPDGFSSSTGKQEYTWRAEGQPASATTHGKFYTVHLLDATPEDRELIERTMGLTFNFTDRGVSWAKCSSEG